MIPRASSPASRLSAWLLARRIALRYVRSGFSSSLVSFMSMLSIAGLAFGVSLLIIVMSVMNGFEREVRVNVLGLVPHLTVTPSDSARATLGALRWAGAAEQIRGSAGVVAVSPVVTSLGVAATQVSSRAVMLNGVERDSGSLRRLESYAIAGDVESVASARWRVVLGATLAKELAVGVGDSIDLFSPTLTPNPLATVPTFRRFEVAAITRVGSEELDAKLVTLMVEDARSLLRIRSAQTALVVESEDVLRVDSLGFELRQRLGSEFSVESWTTSLGAIYRNIEFSRGIVGLMLWMLIAIAAFNLVVSLVMIVRDKRGDIAILMTLGADRETVSAIFLWQGLTIALVGVALGSALGIAGAYWVGDIAAAFERVSGVSLLNPEIYPIDFLPSQILVSDIVGVALGVFALSFLATIYPARQAAALRPASALRDG